MGAVQAQDFGGAKWGVGQRVGKSTEADVEASFNEGRILRTHAIRPTWHFVTSDDIRWILELSAPRTHAVSAYAYRTTELDARVLKRCRKVIEKALEGGRYLTRDEIASALEAAGIAARGLRLGYIMIWSELERVVCSGPRRGKQFTYALFDERAPNAKSLPRDEALAELTRRYFVSHGPATVRDFAWWSGLTMGEARRGVELLHPLLTRVDVEDRTYWFKECAVAGARLRPSVHLLPDYDEFLIAYKDRNSRVFGLKEGLSRPSFETTAFLLVIDGLFAGTWRPRANSARIFLDVKPFASLGPTHARSLERVSKRYGDFIGRNIEIMSTPNLSAPTK